MNKVSCSECKYGTTDNKYCGKGMSVILGDCSSYVQGAQAKVPPAQYKTMIITDDKVYMGRAHLRYLKW